MDTSEEVTSDEDTAGSSALECGVQAESSDIVENDKKTRYRQQNKTTKQSYEADFEWMRSLFQEMS
jgi:hypothetical protein